MNNAELIAWGKMLGGREQELADALEAAEAEVCAAKYAVELRDSARAERDRFAADWVAASLRANVAEAERDAALAIVAEFERIFPSGGAA